MKRLIGVMGLGLMFLNPSMTVLAKEYEVLPGDTFWNIAKEFDTSVDTLYELNNLNSDLIYPEQKLQVHRTYLVEKGDTLYQISKNYGVTVEELKEWNGLTSDLILIGQELTIKEQVHHKVVAAASSIQPTEVKASSTKDNNQPEGKTLSVTATAYTAECDGCTGITYTGINLNKDRNAKVIAVDPNVIPLGSKVYVEGYGYAVAGDIGGAIKGNRIDVHLPTKQEAYNWGVKEVKVTIVE